MKQFLVTAILIAGLLLGACGGAPAATPAPPSPSQPSTGSSSGGITVTDARGRTVQFPEAPQRIIVAGKSSLTIINTLYLFPEARDRVVGLVAGRQKPGDFLAFVDPAFDQKAILEVEAGPEQIAPLKPDVVVLRSFMAEQLGGPLAEVGIPVVYVDLETPEQYFRDLATLGQLFDNSARAEEIRTFYQSRLDAVRDALAGSTASPRTLVVQHNDQGGEVALNVPSSSWIQTATAKLAGGTPVWEEAALGGGWTVVNFEQIAAWDPDKIFVIDYRSDPAEVADRLAANPQWQALKAVKEGQIYGFGADVFSWDQPDPRWILGVVWLATKTHPERFAGIDMMQEVAGFFGEMYGMETAATEKHILPVLKGDVP